MQKLEWGSAVSASVYEKYVEEQWRSGGRSFCCTSADLALSHFSTIQSTAMRRAHVKQRSMKKKIDGFRLWSYVVLLYVLI